MTLDNNDITNELNMDTYQEAKERASNKIYARLSMLDIDLAEFKRDLKSGCYGGITREEVILMITGTEKEILTWNYISSLIEKDEL